MTKSDNQAFIVLDRSGKIAVLKALQSDVICLSVFEQIADKEEHREYFLEMVIRTRTSK
ncbi:hypothetical protein M2480_000427 [Parabacteroides sp. PFB2-12]|uniref:hypothetical protein n=1 Tax=unclassified Parabacteroides TaxID=2649774 RepID=UPI00247595EF|nr:MULTISPECIES: hypothetical protein [unclassified Parabacteroides]MDH6342047.1 hypothetical protein [Parabacteroides sp. PM6-13]MDH6389467.1 hypothetical protein [Parabacteroides sp. PFB2-12]